ncbi:MAG: tyrosine--tRNA ligase [Candidatus Phytoplasma stylosanthis]|nr:tyrosine--tRNA ligase [Candidatus Phytoplasma stylosanthis]
MFLFEELKFRNLIKDYSDKKKLKKLLNQDKIFFYCGFDSTAGSLTIGHLVQIITFLLLKQKGHRIFILIGGLTTLIGDPKINKERNLLSLQEVNANSNKIKKQLKKILSQKKITFQERKLLSFEEINNYPDKIKKQMEDILSRDEVNFINNYDWVSKICLISFFRDYCKHFNINYMISKDKIAQRLKTGISYTEFSYMIFQALDFYYLYKNYNVHLQIGGSDQWGNITSGLELIRKMEINELSDNKSVAGMSFPLLLDNKGDKIGKSEDNAIWLDEKLTSPYQMYQFFLNSNDINVIDYLKMLTLLEVDEIIKLEKETKENPEKRLAQKELAKQVIRFVHGQDIVEECIQVNNILFNQEEIIFKIEDFLLLKKHLFFFEVNRQISLIDALVQTKIAYSKNQAKNLILAGSIKIFQKSIKNKFFLLDNEQALFKKYIILTRKNKINALIIFKS